MLLYHISHLNCFRNSRTCHILLILISYKRVLLNYFKNIITLVLIIRVIGHQQKLSKLTYPTLSHYSKMLHIIKFRVGILIITSNIFNKCAKLLVGCRNSQKDKWIKTSLLYIKTSTHCILKF